MDINSLIATAASAYPDELLLACWDNAKQRPRDNPDAGDTLALFIVREIADTYDATATDAAQCETVITALNCASNEIERVASVMQNLTLPALRPKKTHITQLNNPRRKT
jgi:hypothetical protein